MTFTLYLSQRIDITWAQSYAFCLPNQVFQNEGLYGIELRILQANHREIQHEMSFLYRHIEGPDLHMTSRKKENCSRDPKINLHFKLQQAR